MCDLPPEKEVRVGIRPDLSFYGCGKIWGFQMYPQGIALEEHLNLGNKK